ncbi:ctpV [Symbiodinium natans]|uniref:CtpV protein n=1 Tax=Symbiodinium natans TaxID=878477 RepID=A0A812LUR7_9DINO|nr:ctpV [Symbiodinium natans]
MYLLTLDGQDPPRSIATELVALDDLLEVWPDEVVPADGELVDWSMDGSLTSAAFDESLLTGESRPVPKAAGDTLTGGSRLVTGRAVRLRAKRVGSGAALQQIVAPWSALSCQ